MVLSDKQNIYCLMPDTFYGMIDIKCFGYWGDNHYRFTTTINLVTKEFTTYFITDFSVN